MRMTELKHIFENNLIPKSWPLAHFLQFRKEQQHRLM